MIEYYQMYNPRYRITPYLLKLIAEASALHGFLKNSPLALPWIINLQKAAVAERAHSSTSIEGNPLSLNQVKAINEGKHIRVPQPFEQEVINYIKAMAYIEKHASDEINEKGILALHKLLMNSLLPPNKCGRYKDKQNYILNDRGIRSYTPPSPKETPKFTRELIEWLNSPATADLHCILVCAIFHHRLVSIHPFADGNGRLARGISTWILYQKGFDSHHIFNLDAFFARDRQRYYDKIEQARELDNDLTHWIEYAAEGVLETLKHVKVRIEHLAVSAESTILLSARQEEILRILRDNAFINVAGLMTELNVSRARINQIISPLIKARLVVKEGKSRATRYRIMRVEQEGNTRGQGMRWK